MNHGHARALAAFAASVALAFASALSSPLAARAAPDLPVSCSIVWTYCDTVSIVSTSLGGNPIDGGGVVTTTDGRLNCHIENGVVQAGSTCSFTYSGGNTTFPHDITYAFKPDIENAFCFQPRSAPIACFGKGFTNETYGVTIDPPAYTDVTESFEVDWIQGARDVDLNPTVGPGRVVSAPSGIDCGVHCIAGYPYGTPVTLTAEPDPGAHFVAWTGDCSGQGATCHLVMTSSRGGHAEFAEDPPPTPTPSSGQTASPTSRPTAPLHSQAEPTAAPSAPAGFSSGMSEPPGEASSESAPSGEVAVPTTSSQDPTAAVSTQSLTDLTPVVLAIVAGLALIALAIVFLATRLRPRERPRP